MRVRSASAPPEDDPPTVWVGINLPPAVRAGLLRPGKRAREAVFAEAMTLVGEQPAPAHLGLQPHRLFEVASSFRTAWRLS